MSSNHLPHASSLQTSTPPLAGSWNGSQVASSNDPQSHLLDSLPPLRRSDDSEVELQRFETMAMYSGSSNQQASPDSKLVPPPPPPPDGSHFGSDDAG
ncbi:hypothetical protein ACJ73_07155 [Blastomyces percursus]|uniref:Uncharacterized protein n=1 Tax=Blastomyces percursus TaxID=1658174 RepID=A0A1J9PYV0_9EURO|nr:hypothetical protein ACJ73_07155 [Blastomyces percursus]